MPAGSHFGGEGLRLESGDEECLVRRCFSLLEDPERRDLWTLWDGDESTDPGSLIVVTGLLSGSSDSLFVRVSRPAEGALESPVESTFIRFLASSAVLTAAFPAVC